jgi:spore maturation protein CgeB
MDTPVTLTNLRAGEPLSYVDSRGLGEYDLVLSFTGGGALTALEQELGARKVAPLYGSVDPDLYRRAAPNEYYRADFSYLGTYAADRQPALENSLSSQHDSCPISGLSSVERSTRRSFPGRTTSSSCATSRRPNTRPSFRRRA